MRMCLKFSKKVSDDSKICRDCGAILEDVPDDSVPETGSEWKPASQLDSPWTAEPWKSRQEEGDEQSVGEEAAKTDEPASSDTETLTWKCRQCGAVVPGTFDVCWKCLATKDGEKAEENEPAFFQEDPDASKPDEEGTPSQSVCPTCGSSKMMLGVTVQDVGGGFWLVQNGGVAGLSARAGSQLPDGGVQLGWRPAVACGGRHADVESVSLRS